MIKERKKYHRKYLILSFGLLPFTGVLSLLPFPNFLFFYNVFRLYSHYKAYNGSSILTAKSERINFITSEELTNMLNETQDGVLLSRDKIKELEMLEDDNFTESLNRAVIQIVDDISKEELNPNDIN